MKSSLKEPKAEKRISKFEDRTMDIIECKEHKEKRLKESEESLRDLWDILKLNSIHILGVSECVKKRCYLKKRWLETSKRHEYKYPRSLMNSKMN